MRQYNESTQTTYLGKTKTTLAALSFAQTIMQDQVAKEIFSANNVTDAETIAAQCYITSQVLKHVFTAVKTQDFSFTQLLAEQNLLDILDSIQKIHTFTSLHYQETIKDWSADIFGMDYKEFSEENDHIFKELIAMFNLKIA